MIALRRAAPPVVALALGSTVLERAGADPGGHGRVALLAHFAERPQVTRSFRALMTELLRADFAVVVVSSATCPEPLDWGGLELGPTVVLRKPNVGYDFGSWAVGLARFPQIARSETVLLANDSLLGPFASIRPLVESLDATPADVWGVTETLQFSRHLQSYAMGFRRGVLGERPLGRFWSDVRHYEDKDLVIHRNEIGLSQLLQREGFTTDAVFVAGTVVAPGDNPTIIGWRRLLELGLPFVKREVARSPHLAPDGDQIAEEIRRRFGQDVAEWMS